MDIDRYQRQLIVKEFGKKGQKILSSKKVVLIGCGGLGSNSSDILIRTGVRSLNLVDYDTVQLSNIHRTGIFTEDDVGKEKVRVLEHYLKHVNSTVQIKGINQEITNENIEDIIEGADIIIDGTDNLPLRFLINDVSIKHDIPWIYAGVYSTVGMVMGIIPGKTPCLNCISQSVQKQKDSEIPVMSTLPRTIACIQTMEAIKILLGKKPSGFIIFDTWKQQFDVIKMKRNPNCNCCEDHQFEHL